METIALSIFGNRISSRLDVAEKVMLVKVENNSVKTKDIILLDNANTLKKLDALLQLKPNVLICGGITNLCKQKLKNQNIRIIPWVHGNTENILKLYLEGSLTKKNSNNLSLN